MVVVKVTPDEAFFKENVVKVPLALMRRFVTGENDAYRAGYIKMLKGDRGSNMHPMWIDEFLVGVSGTGRITCLSPPDHDVEEVYDVKPGEAIFMGRGTLRRIECTSDESWIFFYCAIPASSKGEGLTILPPPEGAFARF